MNEMPFSHAEVTVLDGTGAIRVLARGFRYRGQLVEPPRQIRVGDRIAVAIEAPDLLGTQELVKVYSQVSSLPGKAKVVPVGPWTSFDVEILRMERNLMEAAEEFAEASSADLPIEAIQPWVAPPMTPDPFEHPEPTGVVGTFRHQSLVEVVQGLGLGRKTARIEIKPPHGDIGGVGIVDGKVTYAHAGSLVGEPAFFKLSCLDQGVYRIRFGRTFPHQNIEKPTDFLLLEALRQQDEMRHQAASGRRAPIIDAEDEETWIEETLGGIPPKKPKGRVLEASGSASCDPAAGPAADDATKTHVDNVADGIFSSFFVEASISEDDFLAFLPNVSMSGEGRSLA